MNGILIAICDLCERFVKYRDGDEASQSHRAQSPSIFVVSPKPAAVRPTACSEMLAMSDSLSLVRFYTFLGFIYDLSPILRREKSSFNVEKEAVCKSSLITRRVS